MEKNFYKSRRDRPLSSHFYGDKRKDGLNRTVDLRGIELFDIAKKANFVCLHKVDGHTFPAKSARTSE